MDPLIVNTQQEVDIAALLGQRYGDGLVYLRERSDRLLLERAMSMGLVNDEGYLTPSGFTFWQHRRN